MPKGILFIQSQPSDANREDEYNDWYDNTHLAQVCEVPGFVAARRYKLRTAEAVGADDSAPAYAAVYELDTDDFDRTLGELTARATDGRIVMSDALQLDPLPIVTLYELIE